MNQKILDTEVQHFINKHLNEDLVKLVLAGSPFHGISIQELAEQIVSKKKCKNKLPLFFNSKNIYYPARVNIEQTSSEITAGYKAGLISGDSLLDITGGFGVDDIAFAEKFRKVIHCEIIKELSNIAAHNFKILNKKNIEACTGNGIEYLQENKVRFNWIYSDPSRRDEANKKVFLLKDCLPDIPENLDFLFDHTTNILLKLSPVLDISSSVKELKFVKEIHIVAVENEVKELLIILKKDYSEKIIIKTVNFKKDREDYFESVFGSSGTPVFSLPENFLYEPNAAIMKAGLFNDVSAKLGVNKLHNNSHLYTSRKLMDFPGRRFRILQSVSYDRKKLKKMISSGKAHITIRNFPENVATIRKKTGLKEGGDLYLFFTTDINNKHLVLICEKVKIN